MARKYANGDIMNFDRNGYYYTNDFVSEDDQVTSFSMGAIII